MKTLNYIPTHTLNATINRAHACLMMNAGMTPRQIASTFRAVWACDEDGKLGQKYDVQYADGRKDTRRTTRVAAVEQAIAKHRARVS